jgi:hypothetical protein
MMFGQFGGFGAMQAALHDLSEDQIRQEVIEAKCIMNQIPSS